MLPYVAKGTLQLWLGWRTWRCREFSGLSRWIKPNLRVLKIRGLFLVVTRERERWWVRDMWDFVLPLLVFEDGKRRPEAKEHRWLLETGKGKQSASLLEPPERDTALWTSWFLGWWSPSWISDLLKFKTMSYYACGNLLQQKSGSNNNKTNSMRKWNFTI